MDARYDPVNEVLHMNLTVPEFKLQGDYTMNLQYFDDDGNGTVFHGDGHMDITYKGYEVRGAKYPVRYCPSQRKYQLEYPSYEGKMESCTGEWSGIVNGLTGQPVTLEQMLKTNKQSTYRKPFFVEFFRAISNAHIRVSLARWQRHYNFARLTATFRNQSHHFMFLLARIRQISCFRSAELLPCCLSRSGIPVQLKQ